MAKDFEISIKDLKKLSPEEYQLVDIRNPEDFNKGPLENAINIPRTQVNSEDLEEYRDKKIVFSCYAGISSQKVALAMLEDGYEAYSLIGGYGAWVIHNLGKK